MTALPGLGTEWLESDAQGGFANGTVGGFRTRRYHALLLTPKRPPTDRVVLVNGFEAWVQTASGSKIALSTQHYAPDVLYPRGIDQLVAFSPHPWPRWTYRLPDGPVLQHDCVVDPVDGSVVLSWWLDGAGDAAALAAATLSLCVRPLLSGRDYHALMRENGAFRFDARAAGGNATWQPYADQPAIAALSNGSYVHGPLWFRNFLYAEEAARGLDSIEDLASPGSFDFDLGTGRAVLVLRTGDGIAVDAAALAERIHAIEAARRAPPLSSLDRAAEAYLVRRGPGHTVIAGFPWFTDWGRDTFIAMRGLVLLRRKFDIAGSILGAWAATVSEGMLPNRFPDRGEVPEFNAVDASLWYVIAVHEFLAAAAPPRALRDRLMGAVGAILDGYCAGTRFGIVRDSSDGLLACGVPGMQLTWMDAKVGEHVITPRIGKPVEVQALWVNALRCAGSGRHAGLADQAQQSFGERFWNAEARCLYDVVDVDHVRGRTDGSLRPNQVLAVGGLPFALLAGAPAAAVVAKVESELLTPMGLRTLARSDPAYVGHYQGAPAARDGAYHQGTVWPWLIGPFVDAWLRVNGDTTVQRRHIRERCLAPLLAHRETAGGIGHVSEIADGDEPHAPRGCPFQAWSLGELIRALGRTETEGAQP
jgi:predicted glycogen debranching enzyme